VSLDTLYSAGGKSAILLGALEVALSGHQDGQRLLDSAPAVAALAAPDVDAVLSGLADVVAAANERGSGLWAAFVEGANTDAELAAAHRQRDAAMLRAAAQLVERLVRRGLISAPVNSRCVAELCWLAGHPNQYALLVVSAGWTPHAYRDWLVETTRAALVGSLNPGQSVDPMLLLSTPRGSG
jgi:hypothetical protein